MWSFVVGFSIVSMCSCVCRAHGGQNWSYRRCQLPCYIGARTGPGSSSKCSIAKIFL